MAGLNEIPAVILDGDDLKAAQVAVIENVQREDLNPIEEALAYDALIDRFGLTQEQVAKQVGKSRSAVANLLRLLDLPDEVLELVKDGALSAGHARALLSIGNAAEINNAAQTVISKGLSVRETERLAKLIFSQLNTPKEKKTETPEEKSAAAYIGKLEENMSSKLGRKAKIVMGKKGEKGGKLELEYYDNSDLEKLIKALCGDIFED